MAVSPSTTRGKRSRNVVIAALVLAAGVVAWAMLHRSPPPPAVVPPVPVATVQVLRQEVPRYLTGVGTVTANATVTVKARLDGQLDSVGFVEGQDVTAGQVLAQIDPRALLAQVAQFEAQKARDQATLANARLDLQRYTQLQRVDATTRQTLDTQKALVAQLEASVKTDEAQINYARVQLDYTRIVAPLAGRVGARLVDPGNIVHAADANGLVVINQIDPISVVFSLPEEAVPEINLATAGGKSLLVVAYPRNSQTALGEGHLVLLNNQIDTTSGTVSLKATFPNAQHQLWPGQYVNASLILNPAQTVLSVPAAAVQRGAAGTYVYTIDSADAARVQAVKVGRLQDGIAIIDEGLKAGDRVVVDGQYKLKPGSVVKELAMKQDGSAQTATTDAPPKEAAR